MTLDIGTPTPKLFAFSGFVSHSGKDADLVAEVNERATALGVRAYLFEHDCRPGTDVVLKVQRAIDRSHAMILVLTRNGLASNFVHQEIGYALKAGKPVIPLVEIGVASAELAMLGPLEYIKFDPARPQLAMDQLTKDLQRRAQVHDRQVALIGAGVFALILLTLASQQ